MTDYTYIDDNVELTIEERAKNRSGPDRVR